MRAFAILFFLFVGLGSVQAATQLDFVVKQNTRAETLSMYVRDHQVLISAPNKAVNSVVFDANKQSIVILDHGRKTYSTLDQATLSQIVQLAESVSEVAKAQGGVLGDLFSSLGFDSALGKKSTVTLHDKQEKIKIAGLECAVKEVHEDEKLATRLCVRESLPITQLESQTLNKFIQFGQSVSNQAGSLLQNFGVTFPVLPSTQLKQFILGFDSFGDEPVKARLTSITPAKLLEEDFAIPADYQEKSLPI